MNPASRTQNPSKAKRIEDEIAQIDDVNLVFLWDPRACALARLLAVCASPAASRFRSFVSQSCVACSLARSRPALERERERDQNESLLVLCALSCFNDLYCSAFAHLSKILLLHFTCLLLSLLLC
jgi:hypothetical protein